MKTEHVWRCRAICAALLVSVLAGCSGQGNVEPATGATAHLDAATGEIVMPLDAYRFDATEAYSTLFRRVKAIAIGDCMEGRGLTYSAAGAVEDPAASPGDRPFGIWNIEQVRKYGSGTAPSKVAAAESADSEKGGPDWQQAVNECNDSLAQPVNEGTAEHDVQFPEELAFMPTNADYNESLARRLANEALGAAYEDPRFVESRAPYLACLSQNGLTAPEDLGEWGPAEQAEMGSSEDLRISLIDAQCNIDTGMTQNLANIVAEYEQGLINANEAALAEDAEDLNTRIAAAEAYVAANG